MIAMVQTALTASFTPIMEATRQFLPKLFFAVVLLVVGYIIGRVTFSVIRRVLEHTQVDEYFEEEGHLELQLSHLFAELGKWLVYLAFLNQAVSVLNARELTLLMNQIMQWIPGVVGAVAVFLAGYGIAIYTKDHIVGAETFYADLLGKTIFFFVLYIAVSTALPLAGIQAQLLNWILLIIVASVGLAFAIAAGWGLKDVFQEEAQRYMEARED